MFEPGNYRYKYILYKGEPLGTLPHVELTSRASTVASIEEEKAKVVAAVWGAEFIQFLATLAVLH